MCQHGAYCSIMFKLGSNHTISNIFFVKLKTIQLQNEVCLRK